jgi:hypothetical protein
MFGVWRNKENDKGREGVSDSEKSYESTDGAANGHEGGVTDAQVDGKTR